jgi:hypothetical protein
MRRLAAVGQDQRRRPPDEDKDPGVALSLLLLPSSTPLFLFPASVPAMAAAGRRRSRSPRPQERMLSRPPPHAESPRARNRAETPRITAGVAVSVAVNRAPPLKYVAASPPSAQPTPPGESR